MNNIKIRSRNRMNTDTLDDRMMICSNGPPVSPQNKQTIGVIVDLALKRLSMKFEGRWSTARYKRAGVKHLKVISCFVTRTKVRSVLHACSTCKNTVSPRNGDYYRDFKGGREQYYGKS